MFIIIPKAENTVIRELPPELKNGIGIPNTGSIPKATERLIAI